MKDSRRAADTVLTASCPYAIAFPSLPSFESHHSPPQASRGCESADSSPFSSGITALCHLCRYSSQTSKKVGKVGRVPIFIGFYGIELGQLRQHVVRVVSRPRTASRQATNPHVPARTD